jgi:hypothetical protein
LGKTESVTVSLVESTVRLNGSLFDNEEIFVTQSKPETRSRPVPEVFLESGIWVFESHHDSSFKMASSKHRFPELLYAHEGMGQIEFGSQQEVLAKARA